MLISEFLRNLFLPKWQNTDEDVRREAVKKLPPEDARILYRIARDDSAARVRNLAIAKLERLEYLSDLSVGAKHTDTRKAAEDRLVDLLLESDDPTKSLTELGELGGRQDFLVGLILRAPDTSLGQAAFATLSVRQLSDQQPYITIAQRCVDATIRLQAIGRITSDDVLSNVAHDDRDETIALAALERVRAAKVLRRLARSARLPVVRRAAKARLDEAQRKEDVPQTDHSDRGTQLPSKLFPLRDEPATRPPASAATKSPPVPDGNNEPAPPSTASAPPAPPPGLRVIAGSARSADVPSQPAFEELKGIIAERTSPVVAWIGAGLSAAAGLPTWPRLRKLLEDDLAAKASSLDDASRRRELEQLDRVRKETDFWQAFELLYRYMGQTTFQASVRRCLSASNKVSQLPPAYQLLWRLRPTGVINMNLDRLASRAFAEENSDAIYEFPGTQASSSVHMLQSPTPFIMNVHGTVENANSWVLRRSEIRQLMKNEGYRTFIRSVITTRVVLFLGLSADDRAIADHFEALTEMGIDCGRHYWITHRMHSDLDERAEELGIQIIRYDARQGDHAGFIDFLRELCGATPQERRTKPIVPRLRDGVQNLSPLPEPDELAVQEANQVRTILNHHAANILQGPGPDQEKYEQYQAFVKRYDQAVHTSYYLRSEEPHNKLLDYTIEGSLEGGAFGRVYKGRASDGTAVAIKIIRKEILDETGALPSFRRGAESMRILSSRQVPGAVRLYDAFELPACIIMEFVDGVNLRDMYREGTKSGRLDWPAMLKIAVDLTTIIERAHGVPERVLHRDIRPPNIMIRDSKRSFKEWEVVVLDFDLSWHKHAQGKSIFIKETTGYLAPEQLAGETSLTRTSAVDSYGLGMTLLFLATGRDPRPNDSRTSDWPRSVLRQVQEARPCRTWTTLPARYARLILNATQDDQSQRWDVNQILGELKRLQAAATEPDGILSAELWAEEIFGRSGIVDQYDWDSVQLRAQFEFASGMSVQLSGNELDRSIRLALSFAAKGHEPRRNLGKFIQEALPKAVSLLKKGGWEVLTTDRGRTSHALSLTAELRVDDVFRAALAAQALKDAVHTLSFN